ncbi:unnamed protein product [Sphagnum compactum]
MGSSMSGTQTSAGIDDRLLSVEIQVNNNLQVFSQDFYIRAKGCKYANQLQNECEVEIANLDTVTRNYLLTETSPFNSNRTPKLMNVKAGRVSTGLFLVFTGHITTTKITQPPDIMLKLSSKTLHAKKGAVGRRTGGAVAKLSTLGSGVASGLGLSLRNEAPNNSIANYAYSGNALDEVQHLGKAGNIQAFIDDNTFVLKQAALPLSGVVINLSENTGLLEEFQTYLLKTTDDMLPAIVVAYDRTSNIATVQPAIHMVTTDNTLVGRSQVASVPVLALGGGGFFINFPLVSGSRGWIKACDRDISLYLQASAAAAPNGKLLHHFSNGVFIPDIVKGYTISGDDVDNMQDCLCAMRAQYGEMIYQPLSGLPNLTDVRRRQPEAGDLFNLISDVTINTLVSGAYQGVGDFEAVVAGPVPCGTGSAGLTAVVTDVLGWETVSSPNAGVVGTLQQSDEALRLLRRQTLALQGVAILEAITSAINALPGVIGSQRLENYTNTPMTVDGVYLLPNSVWICVDGGTNQDIASALVQNKSLGCNWNGAQTLTVVDPISGQQYAPRWDIPTDIPLLVSVTVKQGTFIGDPTTAVIQAVLDFGNNVIDGLQGFSVGESASPFDIAAGILQECPGLYVRSVLISLTSVVDLQPVEIAMLIYQKATVSEPFANAGDLTPGGIPEGVDPNGYVSYTQGFTFDYQRNLASDSLAKQIQRITINQVLNDVTLALQDLQQWGTPEWIDATDNGGGNFGYNVGAILRYSSTGVAPFGLYYCLNGNSDPNPTANPSNWLNLGNFIGSASKSIQPAIAISNIASPAANTTYPCTVTLMPPADGFIDISGYAAVGAIQSSPNGFKTTITITGTGNSPSPTLIALMLPNQAGPTPGSAILPIAISNSDGSAPLLALDPSNADSTVVTLVQPYVNLGQFPQAGPASEFPYFGEIHAAVAGECLVDLVADGIVDQQFNVTVTVEGPEVATVPPAAIIINPPG